MQLNDYQERATATVLYPKNLAFYYLRPGLLIEVLELEKAFYRHSDLGCYLKGCGNVAWFVANSFTALGLNLEQYQQWAKPTEGLDSLARGIDILKCHADKICAIHIKAICDQQSAAIEALRFHLSTIFHTLDLMAPLLRTNLAAILQMSADDLVKCRRCNFSPKGENHCAVNFGAASESANTHSRAAEDNSATTSSDGAS